MGRPLAIGSDGSPVIFPSDVLISALVDHRLDGEYVACLHESSGLVVPVVGHIGCAMEQLAYSVAGV